MREKIEINVNHPAIGSENILKAVRESIKRLRKKKFIGGQKIELSIGNADEGEMRKLNARYRLKNEPTDVLSFCFENNVRIISAEIILCFDFIKKYCKKEDLDFENEINKNLIHGLLHIVGFEHGKKMFDLQKDLQDSI